MSVLFAIQPDGLSAPEWYLARTPGEVELIPADLIETVQADRIVWLVAGTDVFLSEIEAAARSVEELRTAGLYQLEDELSQPVSSQHLALGPKDPVKPGARHAAVISLNRLSEILQRIGAELELPFNIRNIIRTGKDNFHESFPAVVTRLNHKEKFCG